MNNEVVILENDLEIVGKDFAMEVFQGGMYKNTRSGNDVIEAYLSTLNSKHTVRQFRKSISDFFTYLYGNDIISTQDLVINPVKAVGYQESLKMLLNNGEMKTSTYNAKIKGVKYFYDWLITQTTLNTHDIKVFNINPFSSVKQKAENDSEGSEPLTPDEVLLMLNNPIGGTVHLQTRNILMLEIAISTGIRNNALLSITTDNIKTIDGKTVLSAKDKHNKVATRPITHYHQELLEWYNEDMKLRTDDNGTIFNLHPHSANKIIKEWAKEVGIQKKITFHSLRTTTAVQIYHLTDGNLGRTQLALNHSNSTTTKRYVVKENVINCDAENIVESIKNTEKNFEDFVNSLSAEQMREILLNMNTTTKIQIMNGIH